MTKQPPASAVLQQTPPTLFGSLHASLLARIWSCLTPPDRQALVQVEVCCRFLARTKKVFVTEDPDTLLARLNTRRLFRRLVYYRKHHNEESEDSSLPYTTGKTTSELAGYEWKQLLEHAKKNKEEKEKQHAIVTPPSYELLLFSPCPRAVTVLASYPRSGNSLLRNLFEQVTLRVTGSDMRGGLTQHDLVGEAAVSARNVQFVKTHYPERPGRVKFPAQRAVLLVRNPFDAILSFFHLMMTNTHTSSIDMNDDRMKDVFQTVAAKEIHVWRMFHEFWLQQPKIPILLVRYEDLIRFPAPVLTRVVQFVLEVDNMAFFNDRIQRVFAQRSLDEAGAYKPRAGGIGKSLKLFRPALRDQIADSIWELMHQLGYGEMVDPSAALLPEEWKVPAIPKYGFEMNRRQQQGQTNPVMINNKSSVIRGPRLATDWKRIRKELGVETKGGEDDIQNPYTLNATF